MVAPPQPETFSISEVSALSDLIRRVYADQITIESWGEILQLLGRLVSYKSAGAIHVSTTSPVQWIPVMPDQDGSDRHAEHEPAIVDLVMHAMERGLAVWRTTDVVGEQEWQESPLRRYLKARGLGDMVNVACHLGPGESVNFCLAREDIDNPFADRDIFLLRHLQHHIITAIRLRRMAAATEAAAETFRQVMRPGFICDASGEILEMNKFGRRIIEDPDKDPKALQSIIEETARELIDTGTNWDHIDLLGDKGRLSVHKLTLQTNPPRYAVVIDSYEYFRRVLRHRMQDAGLTAREIEICSLLMQGRSNREIAETLYIAESTVKEHMTNILGKFGVTSRSGIVSRLLGYDT